MRKTAVVSGSTGFIGTFLCAHLLSLDYHVIGLTRANVSRLDKRKRMLLQGVHFIQGDLKHDLDYIIESLSSKVQKGFEFYHLAWGGSNGLSDMDFYEQSLNLSVTKRLYLSVDALGASTFVFVGSMEEAFAENYLDVSFTQRGFYNRHIIYAEAKRMAKILLKNISLNCKVIFVDNSHVMGPLDNKDSFLQVTLSKMIEGNTEFIMSKGDQNFDCISVFDLVRVYVIAAEKGVHLNQYWAGSGNPRPLKEYVLALSQLFPKSSFNFRFGELAYNDIVLDLKVFSVERVVKDLEYVPRVSFNEMAANLKTYLSQGTIEIL
jgi:nucleoside-diphosphate-sugar epimerase